MLTPRVFTNRGLKIYIVWAILITSMLVSSSELFAHQKKEAVTRVLFNPRTESIEIIHRFLIHDAEHVTKQLFGMHADLIGNPHSQSQFADYVVKNFKMSDLQGHALYLTTVGYELDGRYIWIYQETPLQSGLTGLTIVHNALREVWPSQLNLVNVERDKNVQSLVFKGPLSAQSIIFPD